MRLRSIILVAAIFMAVGVIFAQDVNRIPTINGTLRAKYEYQPQVNMGRFQVRNARVSVSGLVIRDLGYKAEIDLCDEGKIKMLDAYVRYKPERWSITAGQMRVPFTIDAHRSPHNQYFANRSFIAKQVGNVRDVGLAGSFIILPKYAWTIEAGVFNNSGLTNQKDFWTNNYYFSAKSYITFAQRLTLQFSCQRIRPDKTSIMMWDAGAYYDDKKWHIEGEYLRKNYAGGAFPGVNAVDAFVCRTFPLKKSLKGISALVRYDFMSDHSNGVSDDEGLLQITDYQRHRLTGGVTLHFGIKMFSADLRLNYEKYFYRENAEIGVSDHDKIVAEIMVRF